MIIMTLLRSIECLVVVVHEHHDLWKLLCLWSGSRYLVISCVEFIYEHMYVAPLCFFIQEWMQYSKHLLSNKWEFGGGGTCFRFHFHVSHYHIIMAPIEIDWCLRHHNYSLNIIIATISSNNIIVVVIDVIATSTSVVVWCRRLKHASREDYSTLSSSKMPFVASVLVTPLSRYIKPHFSCWLSFLV